MTRLTRHLTAGGLLVTVYPHGFDRVTIAIDDDQCGRIATLSMDHTDAVNVADALDAACREGDPDSARKDPDQV